MKLEDQGRVGGVYAGGGFIRPAAQKGVGQGGTGDLGPEGQKVEPKYPLCIHQYLTQPLAAASSIICVH